MSRDANSDHKSTRDPVAAKRDLLLEAHREEYLATCEEYVGMTSEEANEALADFEREALDAAKLLVAATLLALAGGCAVFFVFAWSFGMMR